MGRVTNASAGSSHEIIVRNLLQDIEGKKTVIGFNPDVDAGSPEDIWGPGGDYTGFNAIVDEPLELLSSDADDDSVALYTETSDIATATTIGVAGETFAGDGTAAVGDCIVNTTQNIWGIITVIAETFFTVRKMYGGLDSIGYENEIGDGFVVLDKSADAGAIALLLTGYMNLEGVLQPDKIVLMNGTGVVAIAGTYARGGLARVIFAGATGTNEGLITIRQATAESNIISSIAALRGLSDVAAGTVPSGFIGIVESIDINSSVLLGVTGTSVMDFEVRPIGGSWTRTRFTLKAGTTRKFLSDIVMQPGTDFKVTSAISTADTGIDAKIVVSLIII